MTDVNIAVISADRNPQKGNAKRQARKHQATNAGFHITELSGDYDRSPFLPDTSPYMIWILQR